MESSKAVRYLPCGRTLKSEEVDSINIHKTSDYFHQYSFLWFHYQCTHVQIENVCRMEYTAELATTRALSSEIEQYTADPTSSIPPSHFLLLPPSHSLIHCPSSCTAASPGLQSGGVQLSEIFWKRIFPALRTCIVI